MAVWWLCRMILLVGSTANVFKGDVASCLKSSQHKNNKVHNRMHHKILFMFPKKLAVAITSREENWRTKRHSEGKTFHCTPLLLNSFFFFLPYTCTFY